MLLHVEQQRRIRRLCRRHALSDGSNVQWMRLGDGERQRLAHRHQQRERQLNRGGQLPRRGKSRPGACRTRGRRRTAVHGHAGRRANSGSGAGSHADTDAHAVTDTDSNTSSGAGSDASPDTHDDQRDGPQCLGHCPDVSFTVNGTPVDADKATKFGGGKCDGVKNGTDVSVTGLLQNGTINATAIQISK